MQRLGYGLVGLGLAALTLLALQLLVGRRLAVQRQEQLLSDLTTRLRLGEVALERFTPEGLAEISGLRLAVGVRPEPARSDGRAPWSGADPWLQQQSVALQQQLCLRLGRCPSLRPARSGPRGVWVRMETPLELGTGQDPVWLFMAVPATPWWPPDPLLLAMALATGGLGATLLFLTLEVQRPLLRLERALSALSLEAPHAAPLPLRGSPAVRRLTTRFNAMVTGLAQAGRERATMLAGIAHDLRAPLTRLRVRCDLAGAATPAIGGGERWQADLAALERITTQFLLFAGAERAERPVLLPLHELVAEAAAGFGAVELDLEPLWRRVRPTALARAIGNLLENAISHGRPPVWLELRAEQADPPPPTGQGKAQRQPQPGADVEGFRLVVWDGGPGIAAAEWSVALEPFQRLDPARGGQGHCGLGLAIATRIARDHGGRLLRLERPGAFGVGLSGRSLEDA